MYRILCNVLVTNRQNNTEQYSIVVNSLYNIADDVRRNYNAVLIGVTSVERFTELGSKVLDCTDYYMADDFSIVVTYTLDTGENNERFAL